MNRKIISIFAIFTLILVIPTANAQLSLGGEAKQDLIEIKLNPEGEINVKHIVRSSNVGSTLLIFDNAIIPDQNFTGENELGEEIQLGIIDDGLGNKSIFILPSKYNAIIEYSLEDMILKDNLFTTTISYHEKFDVIFDESIEMFFVNNNSIFLDDKKGIAVNGGGDAKIEFYSNPSKILKEIIWDENKFDLEIIGDAKIERFNFDQASKSISFEITDKSKFVYAVKGAIKGSNDKNYSLGNKESLNIPYAKEIRRRIKLFEKENSPIKHHLFSGVGKRLQFKDSCIAESIIDNMVNKNIPILAIHDSFIVQHRNESNLYKSMDHIFRSFKLKSVPNIK